MEITLIRHTSVNVPPGVCYGQTDVPLQSTFPQEADEVKRRLQASLPPGTDFDQTFTSPLSRCTRLAGHCGYADAKRDARLLELNFGAWEMQPFATNPDPRLAEWYADYLHVPATGGESFAEQYRRVAAFLDELRTQPCTRVAIFSHGGVLVCAQIYAGLARAEEAFSALPPYGGIVHINL